MPQGKQVHHALLYLRYGQRYSIAYIYTTSLNLIEKVLDFVKSGGPILTIDRTIFELWLGGL